MSKIDQIYRDFKLLSKQRTNRDTMYHLILGDDGSGYVEFIDYRSKLDNPFHVTRSTVISFDSLSEGVAKMAKAIEQHPTVEIVVELSENDKITLARLSKLEDEIKLGVDIADARSGNVIFYSTYPAQGTALIDSETPIEIPETLNGLRR